MQELPSNALRPDLDFRGKTGFFYGEDPTRAVVGDVHGRRTWQAIAEHQELTEIFILGDYFDSFGIPFADQKTNFLNLMDAALADPRIHCILGNHDLHYLVDGEQYSGYQNKYAAIIRELLTEYLQKEVFQLTLTTWDGWLISHAGVTTDFMAKVGCETLTDLERRFRQDLRICGFDDDCGSDPYGNHPLQGPLWVRPQALAISMWRLKDYGQIVGHTQMKHISAVVKVGGVPKLICADTGDAEEVLYF